MDAGGCVLGDGGFQRGTARDVGQPSPFDDTAMWFGRQVDDVPGEINASILLMTTLFLITLCGLAEIFRFTKYMLRDVIGGENTNKRSQVVAGMSQGPESSQAATSGRGTTENE